MPSSRRGSFLLGVLVGLGIAAALLVVVGALLYDSVESSQAIRMEVEAPTLRLDPVELTAATTPTGDFGPMPGAWKAVDLATDQIVGLREFQDDRFLVLNLWATWCAPCLAEMPSLEELAAQLPREEFEVALVSWEPLPALRQYFARRPTPLRALALRGEVPALFASRPLPQTFVISPDGRIIFHHSGAGDWAAPETVRTIRELPSAMKGLS